MDRKLFYGDCLTIMEEKIDDASVDLIYLDPPFNSDRNYNGIYKMKSGKVLPELIEAFVDTWKLSKLLDGKRKYLGKNKFINDLEKRMRGKVSEKGRNALLGMLRGMDEKQDESHLSYLVYMIERLIEMHRVLKKTGSIYLHCDPTMSYYLQVVMDNIFGRDNFLNEIVWSYRTGGVSKKWFGRKHDVILFYAKQMGSHTINVPKEKSYNRDGKPYRFKGVKEYKDDNGQWYTMSTMRDVWEINAVGRTSKERTGYPTQKPKALLERVVSASSNEGDVVFDPFCGCATTIVAAEKLKRKWIGIDITYHAIARVSKGRVRDAYPYLYDKHGNPTYAVDGAPNSLESARALSARDSFHFQRWAVESVGGFTTPSKSGDGGVDGFLYFDNSAKPDGFSRMIIQVKGSKVKGSKVTISQLRDLHGTMSRDNVDMAGFIYLEPMGERQRENFEKEMVAAGTIKFGGKTYPKMQMLSIEQIIKGEKFQVPLDEIVTDKDVKDSSISPKFGI